MLTSQNDGRAAASVASATSLPIVAICGRFDWKNNQPILRPHTRTLVRRIGRRASAFRFVAADWRTIGDDNAIDLIEASSNSRQRVPLQTIRLLHLYSVGRTRWREAPLRAKWDQLVSKLAIVEACGVRCVNPVPTIRSGISKRYLLDLAAKGLPVVSTKRVSSTITLEQLKQECADEFQIVKPDNGECGRFVLPANQVTSADLEIYARETDHLLLQPFVAEAVAGERSLVFLGGSFSHAVLKIPAVGDFRANGPNTGTTILPYQPIAEELELARQAAAAFAHPVDTFRLDVVGRGKQLRIVELEVVDPGHYASADDAYVGRMVQFYSELLQ